MDVSDKTELQLASNAAGVTASDIGGTELIQTVVTLSGLPEPLAQRELDAILQMSGQDSARLTLDELRAAMLAYLESMPAELFTRD